MAKCRDAETAADQWKKLVAAYASVTKITVAARGVNGRSVRDTLAVREERLRFREFWFGSLPKHRRPLRIALCLSIAALGLQVMEGLASQISDPANQLQWMLYPYYLVKYLVPILAPAVWGGLGACVYLMKQVSDRLAAFTYEEARLKGYGTRVLIGSIFGVVVVQWLFEVDAVDTAMAGILWRAMAAFVAGLGTKAVYAAFEALIEEIASRIRGAGGKGGGDG